MSNNDIAIKVENLSKNFRLPHEKQTSLKGLFLSSLRGKSYEVQHALQDISFEIKKGEFFGIVGRNGSGKSTLLKIIAGIYTPTKGRVRVNGSLVPFIELGVGFNPELSGRDNVFLNGALLGFSRRQIESMYDDIVEFAELEKFMDQKLKNYSSGMQVRLAFSIAIRAEGDILVLDEVLAVGDDAFQRKCYEYFSELKKGGKTVILVTHNMNIVQAFCTSALFIDEGEVKLIGNTYRVSSMYANANNQRFSNKNSVEKVARTVDSDIEVVALGTGGRKKDAFKSGDEMTLRLKWTHEGVRNVGVAVFKSDGSYIYGTNTFIEGRSFKDRNTIDYRIKLNLAEGSYFVKVGLFGDNDSMRIAFNNEAARVIVNRDTEDYNWQGVVKLESKWL